MIISRNRPRAGIMFAWWPKPTPEGKVWLEHVHYTWQDHGFGGYTYRRLIPEDRYAAGERANSRHPAYRYPEKAYWDWWRALPETRREEIKRFMTADPL